MTRTGKCDSGSAAPALLLALLLVALVAATIYVFAVRLFAAPSPITSDGIQVDRQYDRTLYAMGAAFVLAQLGLACAVWRFRDRGQRAHFIRGSVAAEILWTCLMGLVFLALAIAGSRTWAALRFTPAAAKAIQVEVTASQFVFNFRYAGPDGKFGRLDPALVSAATGNPLGLDPRDPSGRDDIVAPVLTVPMNRPVEILLRSQDVVHNFFVRELRLQQDAVPGMLIPMHFTPNRVGQYEIVCTQLCGLGHHKMRSFLNVVSASDYEDFLKRQAAGQ
jgi:cytochrome c oxidase subunit 2